MRCAWVSLLLGGVLQAHQIAEMPLSLKVEGDRVSGRIEADAAYMLKELRGDEDEEAKDLAWLREQGNQGWARIEAEATLYWKDCLKFEADGKELPWNLSIPSFHQDTAAFLNQGEPEDQPLIEVAIQLELPANACKLDVTWKEPFGVVLIVTTGEEGEAETTPLVSGERATVAERATMADPEAAMHPTTPSLRGWIVLGFAHILPKGLDHILFVLGLFLLLPKWKPLLQQTVTFTLAHSLSLAAAAMGWVKFPPDAVEILIGASIAWVGLENLWVKDLGKWRLGLVGVFGLVHGLGFANVLADLLPADHQAGKLPAALFGFNLGVECGQIAVLLIAFAACSQLGKHFTQVRRIGSITIAIAGLILVLERTAGVDLVPFL